jgi:hypothetical protein
MIDSEAKRRWPFQRPWANVSFVVLVTIICLYLLSIVTQLLVKPGGGLGQKNVTITEVESSVRRAATRMGLDVSAVDCRESSRNEWHCAVRLADGDVIGGSATWHESQHTLGVNVQTGSR